MFKVNSITKWGLLQISAQPLDSVLPPTIHSYLALQQQQQEEELTVIAELSDYSSDSRSTGWPPPW